MSRMKDVYENLTEYLNVIRGRIIDYEDTTNIDLIDLTEEQIEYQKSVWLTVETELENILEGRGL